MGSRNKRHLTKLIGGPLNGQERWIKQSTELYFYPTVVGEDIIEGLNGSAGVVANIPCHVYRRNNGNRFQYSGVENMTLDLAMHN